MNTEVMFSSATDMWATPQSFFNQLNEEFNFNLDPCATPENAKCDKCGKIINIFETITQASNATGISRTAIANNLSYLSKSAGGFIWKKI